MTDENRAKLHNGLDAFLLNGTVPTSGDVRKLFPTMNKQQRLQYFAEWKDINKFAFETRVIDPPQEIWEIVRNLTNKAYSAAVLKAEEDYHSDITKWMESEIGRLEGELQIKETEIAGLKATSEVHQKNYESERNKNTELIQKAEQQQTEINKLSQTIDELSQTIKKLSTKQNKGVKP